MSKGTIARIMDRGFGFIKTEEGSDIFFHRGELISVEFNSLRTGQEVEFEKGQGRDGRTAAVKVRLAEAQADEVASDEAGGEVASDEAGGEVASDEAGGEVASDEAGDEEANAS